MPIIKHTQDPNVLIKQLWQSFNIHAGLPFFPLYLRGFRILLANLFFFLYWPGHFDNHQSQPSGWFHTLLAYFFFCPSVFFFWVVMILPTEAISNFSLSLQAFTDLYISFEIKDQIHKETYSCGAGMVSVLLLHTIQWALQQ